MHRLKKIRRLYATAVTAGIFSDSEGSRVRSAFAHVSRERFLGPGPWAVLTEDGYVQTDSDDPVWIYDDVLVALDTEQGINNGQPSLHAGCLSAVAVQNGERVCHIGAGTGYYTALLARLTGREGSVEASEIDPLLAQRATRNLRKYPQVTLHAQALSEPPPSNVIYISAGTTGPLAIWLDALLPGGRLLMPLTGRSGSGGMLLITRLGAQQLQARFLCPARFIHCVEARNFEQADAVDRAFQAGDADTVRTLRRDDAPDESCWLAGPDWWLSTTAVT